mgnify:FL=1
MKYKEKEILGILEDYINSTYSAHYVSEKNAEDFQIQDLFSHIGIAEEFCRGAALKYLVRFGKKEGKNKKDLFKTLHYVVLMYYYAFMQGEEKNLTNEETDDTIKLKTIENPF